MQQIDRRREVLVLPDRHMQRHHADAVRLAELAKDLVEVGVLPVETRDDDDPRRVRLFELRPHRLRADLDAGGRVHQDDRGVRDAERGVLVAGEVREPGRVEQVDLDAVGGEGREGHVDRDVPLLLFGIGVEDARAVVDLAEARRRAHGMEDGLDEARLARSPVADDGHVSDLRGLR